MNASSKFEVRSSKESRTSKAENQVGRVLSPAGDAAPRDGGDFWTWGNEVPGTGSLREDTSSAVQPVYDLEERTARFAEAVIRFARKVPKDPVTNRLIDQLVGAGTSIAANYAEARDGVSTKDFKNRVGTSRKESRETMLFLRLVATADPSLAEEARGLWREARELNRILGAIWRRTA